MTREFDCFALPLFHPVVVLFLYTPHLTFAHLSAPDFLVQQTLNILPFNDLIADSNFDLLIVFCIVYMFCFLVCNIIRL